MRSLIDCNLSISDPWFDASLYSSGALESVALQGATADRPVAGAQLVGLQSIEHAQHFLGAAADIEVVDRNVLDDAVGVVDERRSQRHAFVWIAHPELIDQRPSYIGKLSLVEALQLRVIAA